MQSIIPRLHDEAGSASWLYERTTSARRALVERSTSARRASCMNACNTFDIASIHAAGSTSWLDERTTSARRGLVEPALRAHVVRS